MDDLQQVPQLKIKMKYGNHVVIVLSYFAGILLKLKTYRTNPMTQAFFLAFFRFLQLIWLTVSDAKNFLPLRLILLAAILPLLFIYLIYSWMGYFFDEIFFRAYRTINIKSPVFVLGIPRSGTTFIHRTLAQDTQYTTFKTWECLFAPSIFHRKFFLAISWIDNKVGAPLHKLIDYIEQRLFSRMVDIHKVSLNDAEEDYFVFLPILHFFLLVLLYPNDKTLWRMAAFEHDFSESRKRLLLNYYYRNIQKHMYVFGQEKIFLSKNASFAAMADALKNQFPDANIFYCSRNPVEALSSQISSVIPAMKIFRTVNRKVFYAEKFHQQFFYFYHYLSQLQKKSDTKKFMLIPMSQLKENLFDMVTKAYQNMGLIMNDDFRNKLQESADKARKFSSAHEYNLAEFSLDSKYIEDQFRFAKSLY